MNLLLVDDEAPALAKLRRFLADEADVRVVGEAADGSAALAFVEAQPEAVDAVLLDIQMPGRSGLEIAAALPAHVLVAFATAYDEYAVQAFDLNAVDYLLKPYTRERLAACVTRLRARLATLHGDAAGVTLLREDGRTCVRVTLPARTQGAA